MAKPKTTKTNKKKAKTTKASNGYISNDHNDRVNALSKEWAKDGYQNALDRQHKRDLALRSAKLNESLQKKQAKYDYLAKTKAAASAAKAKTAAWHAINTGTITAGSTIGAVKTDPLGDVNDIIHGNAKPAEGTTKYSPGTTSDEKYGNGGLW